MFEKNSWLNFVIGLLSFYFVFTLADVLMGKYQSIVANTTHFATNYLWIITFAVALILALILIIFFCKPRAPIFVFVAILLGAVLVMYTTLFDTIIHLDNYFKKEGLRAFRYLIPHLVVVVGSLLALYIAHLSNKLKSE